MNLFGLLNGDGLSKKIIEKTEEFIVGAGEIGWFVMCLMVGYNRDMTGKNRGERDFEEMEMKRHALLKKHEALFSN